MSSDSLREESTLGSGPLTSITVTACSRCWARITGGELCSWGCPLDGTTHRKESADLVYVLQADWRVIR